MISAALQQTVDALSMEERISLLEYLERTIEDDGFEITAGFRHHSCRQSLH
ncbi:MAG: hypothetical protein FWG15_03730 [Propionibacteriaceae bacterium]|nr:hypothetical protein [Propionibacteriaceae bacterium]